MNGTYMKETCKPGTKECCAYLAVGGAGFECAKDSTLRFNIDLRLAEGTMNATGDNCAGYSVAEAEDDYGE